jgi:predicted ATP-dependent endonuclease of OLD family
MYLDLDRKSGSGTVLQRKGRLYPVRIHANPLAGTIGESLNIAESLAGRAYQGFLEEQKRQTDILKQEIVLAAFRPMNTSKFGNIAPLPTQKSKYLKQITHNEGVLPSALAQIGVTEERITNIVQPFFENAKYVINKVPSFKEIQQGQHIDTEKLKALQEFSAITPQLRQVDQLVDLIERYNTDLSKTYLPFKLYLDSVNGFLEESGKSISFTNSGYLCVITGEDGKERELSTLSSGESQLVVILTHLAFNRRAVLANVLIIDEPELSLHLRWQELFVDAIKAASPGIQMVLATHSPSIIGSRVKNCIDIMEARRNDRLF